MSTEYTSARHTAPCLALGLYQSSSARSAQYRVQTGSELRLLMMLEYQKRLKPQNLSGPMGGGQLLITFSWRRCRTDVIASTCAVFLLATTVLQPFRYAGYVPTTGRSFVLSSVSSGVSARIIQAPSISFLVPRDLEFSLHRVVSFVWWWHLTFPSSCIMVRAIRRATLPRPKAG